MGKKILYILIIIALIIAGVFVAKQISKKENTTQTVANTLENTNKTNKQNAIEENNTIEPEEKENIVENNQTQENEGKQNPEEQAKQIVKENWGEDDTVYYSYDGKDETGRYVICVREKATTKALYRYYVDVETGTFDIE